MSHDHKTCPMLIGHVLEPKSKQKQKKRSPKGRTEGRAPKDMSYDHKTCLPTKAKVEPKKGPRGRSDTNISSIISGADSRGTWFALVEKIRCHMHIGQICMFSLAQAESHQELLAALCTNKTCSNTDPYYPYSSRSSTLARGWVTICHLMF